MRRVEHFFVGGATDQNRKMQRISPTTMFGLAIVGAAMLLVGCSSSGGGDEDNTDRDETGEVVGGGDLGVFRLQLGDCLNVPDADSEESEVSSLEGIPCSETHTGEVLLLDDQFFSDLDEYPGQEAAFEAAADPCIGVLEEFTGVSYDASPFDFYSLVPTSASWEALDDRELVCIGFTLDDELTEIVPTTGSLRAD